MAVNAQLAAQLELMRRGQLPPANQAALTALYQRKEPTLMETLGNYGEAGLTMLNRAVAGPLSGLYGIGGLVTDGAEKGADNVQAAQDAMYYQPSQGGQEALQSIMDTIMNVPILGEYLQMTGEAPQKLGDKVFNATNSPLLGALTSGLTGAALEMGIPGAAASRVLKPVSKEAMHQVNMFVDPTRLWGSPKAEANIARAQKYKDGLTPAEKRRMTILSEKEMADIDMTPEEMAQLDDLSDILDGHYSGDVDKYVWEKLGVMQQPNGKWAGEISDKDAILRPLAKAFMTDAPRAGSNPKMELVTYRTKQNEAGDPLYEVSLFPATGKATDEVTDTLTGEQVDRIFDKNTAYQIKNGEGTPDVFDLDADELIEDGKTIRGDIYLNNDLKLSDIARHDKLNEIYPDMFNERINVNMDNMTGGLLGSMNSYGEMKLNANSGPDQILSTMLHEAQHAIQKEHGWPRGGSQESMEYLTDQALGEVNSKRAKFKQDMMNSDDKDIKSIVELAMAKDKVDMTDPYHSKYYGYDADVHRDLLGQAASHNSYIDKLMDLRSSSQPWKFANYSDFYRDANNFRREFGVEPSRRKSRASNEKWWRDLIDYSVKTTAAELPEEALNMAFTLRDKYNSGELSPGKVRGILARTKEKFDKPIKAFDREQAALIERLKKMKGWNGKQERFEGYQDLYGEQQARDTQARQFMTEEERAKMKPMDKLRETENIFNSSYPYTGKTIVTPQDSWRPNF